MIDIKVPTVGESITEVTLLKWTKKDGSYVDRDEVIAELESEKATFEVNAEKAGILKHGATEGDTIIIGTVLAQIDETAEKPADASPKTEVAAPKVETVATPINNTTSDVGVKATPVASAIIADKKVDVKAIEPSGVGGKIMKHDVLEALNNPGKNRLVPMRYLLEMYATKNEQFA
jgi:2-oxoglutarate dehydrogenase E2 component (dihydrolipoamide succinyltransferase)